MEKSKLIMFMGPCVVESPAVTSAIAASLKDIVANYPDVRFCFKASFDKANRTRADAFRGVGKEYGIEILRSIYHEIKVPVITDVHSVKDIELIQDFVSVIQIPAMLCRQTDLLLAAAETGKPLNIKKMQMMAPDDMKYVIEKIRTRSDAELFLTERGTTFGHGDLVVDFRSFHTMSGFGAKVIFDASHSLQRPSLYGKSGSTPDARDIAPKMARAAVAFGVDGVFLECHHNPLKARCDGDTSLYLSQIDKLLQDLTAIRNVG